MGDQGQGGEDADGQGFALEEFLPYLLNNAAESTSRAFATHYRQTYSMTRAQWRILAHLGRFGPMTATDICARGYLEKSKVSRAVAALAADGLILRQPSDQDGRVEILSLSDEGRDVHADLSRYARGFQSRLLAQLGPERAEALREILAQLTEPSDPV